VPSYDQRAQTSEGWVRLERTMGEGQGGVGGETTAAPGIAGS